MLFEYCLTYSASFKCSHSCSFALDVPSLVLQSFIFRLGASRRVSNGIRRKHREGVEERGRSHTCKGPDEPNEPDEPVLVVPNVRSRAREPPRRRSQLSEPQLDTTVTNALGVLAGESIHCRGMAGAFWQHGSLSRFSCLLRCRNNSDVELTAYFWSVSWHLQQHHQLGGVKVKLEDQNAGKQGSNVIQPCTKFESQFVSGLEWIPRYFCSDSPSPDYPEGMAKGVTLLTVETPG